MSADKNPTVNELRNRRALLESALLDTIREHVKAFHAQTGVNIDGVDVEFRELNVIGKAPQTVVSRVRVSLRL